VAAASGIDTSKPYTSGFVSFSSFEGAWYTWVNEGGVKLVFLSMYSSVYNSPVYAVVGQEYNATGGNPMFIGNALMTMEVFNGTELKYTVILNSSQSFQSTPVSQNETNGVLKLHWGVEYEGIDAFLVTPVKGVINASSGSGGGTVAARISLDHLGISYDYTITNKTTSLQSKYAIGGFVLKPPLGSSNNTVSLKGLGLSLLFGTITIASTGYSVTTNSTSHGAAGLSGASVQVGNLKAFQYFFNDNYTLFQPQPTLHRANVTSVPPGSIPPAILNVTSSLGRIQSYEQSLPMFKGLPSSSNLDYSQSKFLYQLSFGQWSGNALVEDPTFIAYLSSSGSLVTTSTGTRITIPYPIVIAAAVSGVVLVVYALLDALLFRPEERKSLP